MIPYMGKNTPIKKIISPIWKKIVVMRKKDPPPPDGEKGLGDFLKGGGGVEHLFLPPPLRSPMHNRKP